MKNKDVVAKILAFHPLIEGYDENPEGCDHYKCGNPDTIVRKVWFCGHIWDNNTKFVTRVDEENIDVCIPQECYDWTLVSYIRDAGQLGLNKAMLMMGHINLEELGMKYL